MIIRTDASKKGLGYVMTQTSTSGNMRVIQMGSTGLTKSQHNYSVNELEMLSIQWALEKLKIYTVGEQKVVVLTDNSSLVGTWNKSLDETENPRMIRLMEKMAHINLEIRHTK